jgi:hypothetical protein
MTTIMATDFSRFIHQSRNQAPLKEEAPVTVLADHKQSEMTNYSLRVLEFK